MNGRVDVVIVGGGPAGSAAAIELARSGVRVTLADGTRPGSSKVGEALPPAANPLLRQLGVWDCLLAEGHRRSPGNSSLWGSAFPAGADFIRDPNGAGWHVERDRFDATLRTSARQQGATLLEGVTVSCRERTSVGWRLVVDNGESVAELQADWVIDCSGRRNTITRHLGIRRIRYDGLVGAVLVLQCAAAFVDVDHLTVVEAAPDGWWYTAAVPGGRRVTAYFTDPRDPSAREARSRNGYARLLAATRAVGARVIGSGYRLDTPPRFVSADSSRLERFAGSGWVAAGEAAAAFDPLSSQGMFFALRSGLNAARTVRCALTGDAQAVDAYSHTLERAFATYLLQRQAYYRAEQRWADRPFWHQRHQPPADRHQIRCERLPVPISEEACERRDGC